jgi:DNA polymerase-4
MSLYGFPHHKDIGHNLPKSERRFFIHMDFDAFFAQVEQRDNPKLKDKPVSVGGNGGNKGIVMTSSYEARAKGVKTGMSVVEAREFCPELISLPCYGPKYEAIVQHILEELVKFVPEDCIEQYSIDECFIDISPVVNDYWEAAKLAYKIKKMVMELEDLTVSIGLSYNKSYSKLSSKFKKPDGLTIIKEENRNDIYKLPVGKIWGVGRRVERRLALMGIFTIGGLANCDFHAIHKEFGINGVMLRKIARGEDTSGISKMPERIEKSFNHHHTLTDPIYKPDEVYNEMKRMTEYVCRRMRAKDLIADHTALTVRFDDLGFVGDKLRLSHPTNDEREIFDAAKHIYKKLPQPDATHKLRMFGITVFDLYKVEGYNLDMFNRSRQIPYKQVDRLKEKYGERIIRIGLNRA